MEPVTGNSGDCPRCGGSGWIIVEKEGISGAERCTCALLGRAERVERSAGIPPRYQYAAVKNFLLGENPAVRPILANAQRQASDFVREFPLARPQGIMFMGDPGCGKTHLAVGILRGVIEKGFQGVFFDYQDLLGRIRSGYDAASGASDREAYRVALEAEVLLLDDLGAHRVTEWVEDTVTSIITHRCNNQLATIITTNLPDGRAESKSGKTEDYRKTLAEVIGLRARSRLSEMCRIVSMFGAPDYRPMLRG